MSAAHEQYALGRSPQEYARLARQAEIMKPMTRRLFAEAGVQPGMRVVDLGSGAGDVCMLLAEMVGLSGTVIGLDSISIKTHCSTPESEPLQPDSPTSRLHIPTSRTMSLMRHSMLLWDVSSSCIKPIRQRRWRNSLRIFVRAAASRSSSHGFSRHPAPRAP
jgi:hypothetical protein